MDQTILEGSIGMSSALSIPDENTPLVNVSSRKEIDLVSDPTIEDINQEIKNLIFNSLPIIASFFIQAAMPLASVSFIGHLGSTELGAAALSNMFATITGWSISLGMSSCLDTLCSQSFTGGEDPHEVGLHMQRGILISLAMFFPISFVWWHAEPLMLLLGQDPELSRLCGVFLRILLLGVPPFMIFDCVKKFLQAQRIFKAQTYISCSVLPLNLFINYILILNPTTSIGFIGAPFAAVLTNWLTAMLGVLYIVYVDGYKCWGGFSMKSFSGWGVYFKLGIPGVIQVCSEWWAFEIMALSCSYLGTDQLAAHSIATSINTTCYSLPFGQSVAASNRIGNLLGMGLPNRAKLASRCALILSVVLPFISVFSLLAFRNTLPYLFTSDQGVIDVFKHILPLVAFYQISDCVNAVCGGVMRGQGRQKIGAIGNIIAFYVLAIPMGLYAAFQLDYGVFGLWMGNTLALTIASSSLTIFILHTDWVHQVNLCKNRLLKTSSSSH